MKEQGIVDADGDFLINSRLGRVTTVFHSAWLLSRGMAEIGTLCCRLRVLGKRKIPSPSTN